MLVYASRDFLQNFLKMSDISNFEVILLLFNLDTEILAPRLILFFFLSTMVGVRGKTETEWEAGGEKERREE